MHHDGLQVLGSTTGEEADVPPRKDAFVINMGDIMSRITDDQYKSSLHRILNKITEERYGIVYFFSTAVWTTS